jgi:hypothetical protein
VLLEQRADVEAGRWAGGRLGFQWHGRQTFVPAAGAARKMPFRLAGGVVRLTAVGILETERGCVPRDQPQQVRELNAAGRDDTAALR